MTAFSVHFQRVVRFGYATLGKLLLQVGTPPFPTFLYPPLNGVNCSAFSTYWNVVQGSAFSTRVLNGQRKILPRGISNHHRLVSPLKIQKPSMTSSKGYRTETDLPWNLSIELSWITLTMLEVKIGLIDEFGDFKQTKNEL